VEPPIKLQLDEDGKPVVAYLKLQKGDFSHVVEVWNEHVVMDCDDKDGVLGIEILGPPEFLLALKEQLERKV